MDHFTFLGKQLVAIGLDCRLGMGADCIQSSLIFDDLSYVSLPADALVCALCQILKFNFFDTILLTLCAIAKQKLTILFLKYKYV